jgi:hypothetical protein
MSPIIRVRNFAIRLFMIAILTCIACKTNNEADSSRAVEPSAVASSSVTANSTEKSEGSAESSRCKVFCAHTESLECGPVSLCETGCQKMLASPTCPTELRRFFDCAQNEPVGNWECNKGTPALKNGFCDASQAAFVGCLRSKVTAR